MSLKNNLLILLLIISVTTFIKYASRMRPVDFLMAFAIGIVSGVLITSWTAHLKSRREHERQ
jgi:hypothetical protein